MPSLPSCILTLTQLWPVDSFLRLHLATRDVDESPEATRCHREELAMARREGLARGPA